MTDDLYDDEIEVDAGPPLWATLIVAVVLPVVFLIVFGVALYRAHSGVR